MSKLLEDRIVNAIQESIEGNTITLNRFDITAENNLRKEVIDIYAASRTLYKSILRVAQGTMNNLFGDLTSERTPKYTLDEFITKFNGISKSVELNKKNLKRSVTQYNHKGVLRLTTGEYLLTIFADIEDKNKDNNTNRYNLEMQSEIVKLLHNQRTDQKQTDKKLLFTLSNLVQELMYDEWNITLKDNTNYTTDRLERLSFEILSKSTLNKFFQDYRERNKIEDIENSRKKRYEYTKDQVRGVLLYQANKMTDSSAKLRIYTSLFLYGMATPKDIDKQTDDQSKETYRLMYTIIKNSEQGIISKDDQINVARTILQQTITDKDMVISKVMNTAKDNPYMTEYNRLRRTAGLAHIIPADLTDLENFVTFMNNPGKINSIRKYIKENKQDYNTLYPITLSATYHSKKKLIQKASSDK